MSVTSSLVTSRGKLDGEKAGEGLSGLRAAGLALGAVAAFHLAYQYHALAFLMGVFLYCLCELTAVRSTRVAFYGGWLIGLALYVPGLAFFGVIFGKVAVVIWLIAAVWPAVFLLLGRVCRGAFPRMWGILVLPVLWTGLEYFRSEVYYLRFSWLNVGLAFSGGGWFGVVGEYGVGFIVAALVAVVMLLPGRRGLMVGGIFLAGLAGVTNWPVNEVPGEVTRGPLLVGIQLEATSEREVVAALDGAIRTYPQGDLFIVGEYTFYGPVPEGVRSWCRRHRRYLMAGGTQAEAGGEEVFTNTAFVVGPEGSVVFQQGKSVPIQFFSDGLPARKQEVWDSPWGKIGVCICYDLSYRRVTDGLIRKGAGAIIVPTLDLISWGRREHEEHARMGPMRAAEYRVPVVRVCSSGVSQIVGADGTVLARGEYPGQGQVVAGRIAIQPRGRVPWDAWVAPICVGLTGVACVALLGGKVRGRLCRRRAAVRTL